MKHFLVVRDPNLLFSLLLVTRYFKNTTIIIQQNSHRPRLSLNLKVYYHGYNIKCFQKYVYTNVY